MIFFCVPQKMEQHEGKSWQNFQFWINYPFKGEVWKGEVCNKQNCKYY